MNEGVIRPPQQYAEERARAKTGRNVPGQRNPWLDFRPEKRHQPLFDQYPPFIERQALAVRGQRDD